MLSYDDFINSLNRGDTYLFHGKINTSHVHYQVILNNEISVNTVCVFLSVSTSQISKRKEYIESRNLDSNTLVIISPDEVTFLSKESCFNCNDPKEYNTYDLYGYYLEKKLIYQGKLPDKIMLKILEGIKISELVSNRNKKIIGML